MGAKLGKSPIASGVEAKTIRQTGSAHLAAQSSYPGPPPCWPARTAFTIAQSTIGKRPALHVAGARSRSVIAA
jgi:hypothetical protein